jgi:hypothetical protein
MNDHKVNTTEIVVDRLYIIPAFLKLSSTFACIPEELRERKLKIPKVLLFIIIFNFY